MKSVSRINEKCLDMQQDKKQKCSFLESVHQQKLSPSFSHSSILQPTKLTKFAFWEYVQSKVQDIEEIVELGKKMNTCPYYGVRESIPNSEVVALPYNTLFHKSTRESLNIKLEGNIVIIDEAHNLTEAINNMYSVHLSFAQISSAHSQLLQYLEKYKSKLKHKNIRYIKEILFILSSFLKFISNLQKDSPLLPSDSSKEDGVELLHKVTTVNDFVFDSKIDNINLFKIEKYLLRSQIVPKVFFLFVCCKYQTA